VKPILKKLKLPKVGSNARRAQQRSQIDEFADTSNFTREGVRM
jgi:hypothetical protein